MILFRHSRFIPFLASYVSLLSLAFTACSGIRVLRVEYPLPTGILAPISAPNTQDRSKEFARLFCSVLNRENPDEGTWGNCEEYLETPVSQPSELGQFPTKYRLLVVPGLLNTCASPQVEAFKHARNHLEEAHHLGVEYLALPESSSEANARTIADYLKRRLADDRQKYIVLGYSKGATDLQVSLATHEDARLAVAAMIAVAGTVGGSRLMDILPKQTRKWIRKLHFGTCDMGDGGALSSLNRGERQTFLERFPEPVVPTYSLVAVSNEDNTSLILRPSWRQLSAYESEQDSQMIKYEAIVPGSVYLGAARADHWAVAMSFENAQSPIVRAAVNHNRFPRTALLEALVRFVNQDLNDKQAQRE